MGLKMSLKVTLQDAMKDAMRAKDKARLSAIRMILAEIKRLEVDARADVDDTQVLAILDKMQKQRRDSMAQYEKANRADLAEVEQAELAVIGEFLPQPLSPEDLQALIRQVISAQNAQSMADMGKVMAAIKPQVQGRADMAAVSQLIKAQLNS
jgi:uncharacterized protein YqeY